MNKTHQKTKKPSKSFKAPNRLAINPSDGAYFKRKKPRPIKELKEEYENER